MTTIKEVIKRIVDKLSSLNGYKKAWIEKHWLELIGEAAVVHALPYKVERNILFVRVDSSVWNQELFMDKRNLINKVNNSFSKKIIDDVKFQIGYFNKNENIHEMSDDTFFLLEKELSEKRASLLDRKIIKNLQRKKN
ncbi:MAG: DUF721 domain-containing protein [Negativicutes bacterium]